MRYVPEELLKPLEFKHYVIETKGHEKSNSIYALKVRDKQMLTPEMFIKKYPDKHLIDEAYVPGTVTYIDNLEQLKDRVYQMLLIINQYLTYFEIAEVLHRLHSDLNKRTWYHFIMVTLPILTIYTETLFIAYRIFKCVLMSPRLGQYRNTKMIMFTEKRRINCIDTEYKLRGEPND